MHLRLLPGDIFKFYDDSSNIFIVIYSGYNHWCARNTMNLSTILWFSHFKTYIQIQKDFKYVRLGKWKI